MENLNEELEVNVDFEIKEISGDLFSCDPGASLAHCVSRDLKMGKGIAVEFKKRFGGVRELEQQGKGIGEVAVLQRGNIFVYYLITKESYFNKPSYGDLERSLVNMKDHMQKNRVKKLAIPKLGCGLDGLLWPEVKVILKRVFGDLPLQIEVYSLPTKN